jgi:hypothetical protein
VGLIDGTLIPLTYEPINQGENYYIGKVKLQIKLFVNLENNFKHDISIPKSCRESHDFTNSQM